MKVFNAMGAKDIIVLEETLHDDFIYFGDDEMRTEEEWLKGSQGLWNKLKPMDEEHRVLYSRQL